MISIKGSRTEIWVGPRLQDPVLSLIQPLQPLPNFMSSVSEYRASIRSIRPIYVSIIFLQLKEELNAPERRGIEDASYTKGNWNHDREIPLAQNLIRFDCRSFEPV